MFRSVVLALVLTAVTAGVARAKAVALDPFVAYVGDLAANPKAAAAHLADCELILLPGGEVRTPCTLAIADLIGNQPGVTLVTTRLAHTPVPRSLYEYVDADVEARAGKKVIATFHVIEMGSSDNADARFVVSAAHWARTLPDKDAIARARAKQLPAAPAIKDRVVPLAVGGAADKEDRAEGIDAVKGTLTASGDMKDLFAQIAEDGVVFGSAPGQKLAGKRGAKTLRGWKVGLAQRGGLTAAGNGFLIYAATDVVGTPPGRSSAAITYATFVVYRSFIIEGSGDHAWEPALASFGIPQ